MQPYHTSAHGKGTWAKHYGRHPPSYSTNTSDQESTEGTYTGVTDSEASMSERSNLPFQQAALSNRQDGQKTSDDAKLSTSGSNSGSSSPVCILPATVLFGSAVKSVSFGSIINSSNGGNGAAEADRHVLPSVHGSEMDRLTVLVNTKSKGAIHKKDVTTAHEDSSRELKPAGYSMRYQGLFSGHYVSGVTETRRLYPPPKAKSSAESDTAISVGSTAGSHHSVLETELAREEPLHDVRLPELASKVYAANKGVDKSGFSRAATSRSDVTTEEIDGANVAIKDNEDDSLVGIHGIVKPMHEVAMEGGDNDADDNRDESAGRTKVEEKCTEGHPDNISTLATTSVQSLGTVRTGSTGQGLDVQDRRHLSEQHSDDIEQAVTAEHPKSVSILATPYAESLDPIDTGSIGQSLGVQGTYRLPGDFKDVVFEEHQESVTTFAGTYVESLLRTVGTGSTGQSIDVQDRGRISEQYSDDTREVGTGRHGEHVSILATPYAESLDPAHTGTTGQNLGVQGTYRLPGDFKEVVFEEHQESVTTFAGTYVESLLRTIGIKFKGQDIDRTVHSEQYSIEDTRSSKITIRLSKLEPNTSDSEGMLRKEVEDESRHEQTRVATKCFSNIGEQTEFSTREGACASGMCSNEINPTSSLDVNNGSASVMSDEMTLTPARSKPKALHSGIALAAIWDLFERTKSRQSVAANAGRDPRSMPQLALPANPNTTAASRRNLREDAEKEFGTRLTLPSGTTVTERLRRGDRGINMSISDESCLTHRDLSVQNDGKAKASWRKLWGRAKELSAATGGNSSVVGQGSSLPIAQSGEPHVHQAVKGATHGHVEGHSHGSASSSSGDTRWPK